jgi:hypothetical protein
MRRKEASYLPPNRPTTQRGLLGATLGQVWDGMAMALDRYMIAALSGLAIGIVLLLGEIVVRGVEATGGNIAADSSVTSLRGSVQ